VEAARKELAEAVSHTQELTKELQRFRLKYDYLKRQVSKQKQGFIKTIAAKDCALSTLRNHLQQGQVALMAENKEMNVKLNSWLGTSQYELNQLKQFKYKSQREEGPNLEEGHRHAMEKICAGMEEDYTNGEQETKGSGNKRKHSWEQGTDV